MKCEMPAARAPGTSVSPSASRVSASPAFNRRKGTPWARASRAVRRIGAPPAVNASAPSVAPRMKSLRFISCMMSPRQVRVLLQIRSFLRANVSGIELARGDERDLLQGPAFLSIPQRAEVDRDFVAGLHRRPRPTPRPNQIARAGHFHQPHRRFLAVLGGAKDENGHVGVGPMH